MNSRYHPAPQAPLSSFDAYTSWPGGVDPSVSQFRTEGQAAGKWCRSRKNRKASRKASRKNRKASRKNRKA